MEKTGCKINCGAQTTLTVKGLMMMMKKTWRTWIQRNQWRDVCATVSPLGVQNLHNMKLHALWCPLTHGLFFTIFCFLLMFLHICPEVSAYKASILSFSSYFIIMIKNKMPSGHHVTHKISAKSDRITIFFFKDSSQKLIYVSMWYLY